MDDFGLSVQAVRNVLLSQSLSSLALFLLGERKGSPWVTHMCTHTRSRTCTHALPHVRLSAQRGASPDSAHPLSLDNVLSIEGSLVTRPHTHTRAHTCAYTRAHTSGLSAIPPQSRRRLLTRRQQSLSFLAHTHTHTLSLYHIALTSKTTSRVAKDPRAMCPASPSPPCLPDACPASANTRPAASALHPPFLTFADFLRPGPGGVGRAPRRAAAAPGRRPRRLYLCARPQPQGFVLFSHSRSHSESIRSAVSRPLRATQAAAARVSRSAAARGE